MTAYLTRPLNRGQVNATSTLLPLLPTLLSLPILTPLFLYLNHLSRKIIIALQLLIFFQINVLSPILISMEKIYWQWHAAYQWAGLQKRTNTSDIMVSAPSFNPNP